ncbi:hypothetical protein QBC47DRAFT_105792 [Echria macrotheca]|uniref:Uncharacterized protein n=1 Tax=Echria macrotheca TaxID=438768 RepID=A0AAJ0BJH6_9PEZI|nr:hypothetical protein QBC47DRAFT_105792 [Echria macrotheca]
MGFLSFLSKRSGDKAKPKPKADESGPGKSAVVQAPTLLPRNAVPRVQEASRGRPRLVQIYPPPDTEAAPELEAPAPAPAVPLFRDESAERPSTAPNASKPATVWAAGAARLRKNPMRGPPVSLRMVRPSTANPAARPVSQSGLAIFAGGEAQGSRSHSRSNSITNSTRSDGSKAYKDLLDAQSEIKPADFKSRVKASGARDYGEDVADRNLGENGFDLGSSHVQAFYAQSSNVSQKLGSSEPAVREGPSSAIIANIRTKSLNSSAGFTFPKTAAHIPGGSAVDAMSPLLRRRQSVNTYMPGGDSSSMRHPSSARYGTTSEDEKSSWNLPTLPRLKLSSPNPGDRPRTAHSTAENSPRSPRASLVAKQRAGAPMPSRVADEEPSSLGPSAMPSPLRTSPRSRRGSVNGASASPRKRHSLHTLHQSASFASHDPAFDPTPLSYPRHKSHYVVRNRVSEQPFIASLPDSLTIDFDVASSPTKHIDPMRSHYLGGPFTIPEVPEVESELGSNRSINLEDSPGQATLRTRSLRALSASSATPTASDTSSNPFQRPQSRHTANTSVDLSHGAPSLSKVPSHASLDSGAAMSPKTARSSNFNIDDYISSDDDSFIESRRPRGEGEEGLLFSDSGYGAGGFQLPGLTEAVPISGSPKSKQLLQHARSSISLPPIYDSDSFGRAGARRFILDTAADSDDDDDEQYHSAQDTSPLRGRRGTKRLSAICASPLRQRQSGYAHDVIVEERTGKVDVAAAVRLRKEAKARKRASGVSLTRPKKTKSAGPLGITSGGLEVPLDDEANHADIE